MAELRRRSRPRKALPRCPPAPRRRQTAGTPLLSEHPAARLEALGPYFGLRTFATGSGPGRPWRQLGDPVDRSRFLDDHYRFIQDRLELASGGPVQARVAMSTGHLGVVGRLVCLAMGASALGLTLDLSTVWLRPAVSGPLPVLLSEHSIGPLAPASTWPASHPTTATSTAATSTAASWTVPVAAVTDATARLSVSRHVLQGNIDSAVNAAAAAIGTARPDLAATALTAARTWNPHAGPGFRRTSCCLIYRTAGTSAQPFCGDCILSTPPAVGVAAAPGGSRGYEGRPRPTVN